MDYSQMTLFSRNATVDDAAQSSLSHVRETISPATVLPTRSYVGRRRRGGHHRCVSAGADGEFTELEHRVWVMARDEHEQLRCDGDGDGMMAK